MAANENLLAQIQRSQELAMQVQATPSVQEKLNDFEEEQVARIISTFKSDNNSQFAASVLTLICDEQTQHPSLIARRLYGTIDARAGTPQYRALLLHVTRVLPGFKNPKKLNNVIQFFTTMQEDSQGTPMNGASDGEIIATAQSLLRKSPVKSIIRGQIPIKLSKPNMPRTGKFAPRMGGTRKRKSLRKRTRKRSTYKRFF